MSRALVRPDAHDLTRYDPAKGLQKIAVAEAAERHFKRAKDATKLLRAVELKLTEQRNFILWWDSQEKNPGGKIAISDRRRQLPTRTTLGLDHNTIHRWRIRLKDEAIFATTLAQAQEQCLNSTEFRRQREEMKIHFSSATDAWNTPPEIVTRVLRVLDEIDLDPCSNSGKANVPARQHYRENDDGLSKEWRGKVYMNPPYGDAIGDWVKKLCTEFVLERVAEAIALVPARTDTEWFRAFRDFPVCFIAGRLRFGGADNSAPFPSLVVYLGDRIGGFVDAFSDIGDVWMRWRG